MVSFLMGTFFSVPFLIIEEEEKKDYIDDTTGPGKSVESTTPITLIRLMTTRRIINQFAPLEVTMRIRIHPSGGGSHDFFFAADCNLGQTIKRNLLPFRNKNIVKQTAGGLPVAPWSRGGGFQVQCVRMGSCLS